MIKLPKKENLLNRRFNRLLVIEEDFSKSRTAWKCLCDCGKTVIKRKTELKTGKATSCGCNGNNILIGKKYGKLTVVSNTYYINKWIYADYYSKDNQETSNDVV